MSTLTTSLPAWFHERTRDQFVTESELCSILKYKTKELDESVNCGKFPKEDKRIQQTRLWRVDSIKNLLIKMTTIDNEKQFTGDCGLSEDKKRWCDLSKEVRNAIKKLSYTKESRVRLLDVFAEAIKEYGTDFYRTLGYKSHLDMVHEADGSYSANYVYKFRQAAQIFLQNGMDNETFHQIIPYVKSDVSFKCIYPTCKQLQEYGALRAFRMAHFYHFGSLCSSSTEEDAYDALKVLGKKEGVSYSQYIINNYFGRQATQSTPVVSEVIVENIMQNFGELESCMNLLEYFVVQNCSLSVFDIATNLGVDFDILMDMLETAQKHELLNWSDSDEFVTPDVKKIKNYLAFSSIDHNIKEAADVLKYNKELVSCFTKCQTPELLRPENLVFSALKQGHKVLTREAVFFLSVLVDKKLAVMENEKYKLLVGMPKLAIDIQAQYEVKSEPRIKFTSKQQEILHTVKNHTKVFPALITLVSDYGYDKLNVMTTNELIETLSAQSIPSASFVATWVFNRLKDAGLGVCNSNGESFTFAEVGGVQITLKDIVDFFEENS